MIVAIIIAKAPLGSAGKLPVLVKNRCELPSECPTNHGRKLSDLLFTSMRLFHFIAVEGPVQLPEAELLPAAEPILVTVSLPVRLRVLPKKVGAACSGQRRAVPLHQPCLWFHRLHRCAKTTRQLPARLCPDGNESRFAAARRTCRRRNPNLFRRPLN